MAFWIFLFFIGLPIVEVAIFVQMVGEIGLTWSLVLVIIAALGGLVVLRMQGFAVFREAQAALARGEAPVEPVMHGVVLLGAGMLFLIPGFVSDLIAFLLLVPDIRLKLAYGFLNHTVLAPAGFTINEPYRERANPSAHKTIHADYEDRTPPEPPFSSR